MDRLTASQPDISAADVQPESRIDRDVEAVIHRYFETFNAGDFAATAALFAPEGALFPPFESAVVGQEAIAAYLNQEAEGMRLELRQCVQEEVPGVESATSHAANETGANETGANETATSEIAVKVAGKVQTPLFGVNVTWTFLLKGCSAIGTSDANRHEILSVRVKLLAALEDLLKLKS